MPKFDKIRLLFLCCFAIFFFSCKSEKESDVLKIATAANMQFAMNDLIETFQQETGIQCEIVITSSGKLTAQIKAGAPFDVFVSADLKYPNTLFKEGFGEEKPKIYANGTLVLWTTSENIEPSLDILFKEKIKHIAVANPKTAPYGRATEEFLEKTGKFNELESKLVFGESISAVNRYIHSGSAAIGFTAKSVVLSPKMKNVGNWIEIDPSQYSSIQQAALLLKSEQPETIKNARKFYEFLFSAKAKEILEEYGYRS
ncbi:molybdate ABC transporter substrate-binding protein [Zunongwangia atlantica]|uniref:Molybdenum ABC transporter periplasmic molybdate-binding protein n=1 Tax=Zunongwangia atlantica 22II14-10F7 TaxID=1185767 RepID=A0A1Y1T0J3_9FLAO|nr:molybdate ABC transporter substrate-binding protein [Zunongwangia atlantica]ORL44115.1 molybdenum ABC transporter periplasmic molybdate-binding protein [Zunongwangia atlantica 22II14-10F7]